MKNPEISVLASYEDSPGKEFWVNFPTRPVPITVSTPVYAGNLASIVKECSDVLTIHQKTRAKICVKNLIEGASSHQIKILPPVFTKNSNSAVKHGRLVTDKIVSWIKDDIVAGPFQSPPIGKFRVNPLIAVEQHNKVRPVLNVSEPVNRSFNDNVNQFTIEKVFMASASDFGYAIVKCGLNSNMSKFDLVDAYKNIPAKIDDLRLQGFCWLGKYFIETQQIFGAKTSVSNFDIFAHTILDLAIAKSKIPKSIIFRRLDDIPIVSPDHVSWCNDFTETFVNICSNINVKLAQDCPDNEKAFKNQKRGRVLGVDFDTSNMSWSYPEGKKSKCLSVIKEAYSKERISLLEMQKFMVSLGDLGQLCPFMKGFKKPLNDVLSYLQNDTAITAKIPPQGKKDLLVWAGMLSDKEGSLPIPHEPCEPPLACKVFTTDAAGNPNGETNTGSGVGGIGLNAEGKIILAFQYIWNEEMICDKKDSKGARFGAKTSTLEMAGLVIPFLLIPEEMSNQHLIFQVDNISCYFGWKNKSVKNDITASILVRSVLLISAYLGSCVHVRHLPRVSTWEADIADRLSRVHTRNSYDKMLLSSFSDLRIPKVFTDWLDNPIEDWDLPVKLAGLGNRSFWKKANPSFFC